MKKFCKKCDKEYAENIKKCPLCGKRLKNIYTEKELSEIEKQNEDMAVIQTTMLM